MGVRLDKPWTPLTEDAVAALGGHTGVFQIADEEKTVIYIGYAGGRSLFGLKGELEKEIGTPRGAYFRTEVNAQYMSRYQELLMLHVADFGALPERNAVNPPPRLGRLSPA